MYYIYTVTEVLYNITAKSEYLKNLVMVRTHLICYVHLIRASYITYERILFCFMRISCIFQLVISWQQQNFNVKDAFLHRESVN